MGLTRFFSSKVLIRSAVLVVALAAGSIAGWAQSPTATSTGFTLYEESRASTSDSGQFAALDTNVGFDFNRHVGLDVGVPVYFIRATLAGQSHDWLSRLGDPYADARFAVDSKIVDYTTIFTVSVPAQETGAFSTGHAGLDWFNHLDHQVYRFIPFVNAGVANGILNTTQLSQPFRLAELLKTSGFVGIAEGGTDFKVWRRLKVGSSFYAIEPAGTQKIAGQPLLNSPLTPEAVLLDHDRGFSAWVRLLSTGHLYTQVGYNHSIKLDQDAATVTVGLDFSSFLRRVSH